MSSSKPKLDSSRQTATGNVTHEHSKQSASQVNAGDISLSADADTIRLVALEYNEALSIDEGPADPVVTPFDPYNNTSIRALDNKPRKSIDDLRKLSAEITKAKHAAPKRK